MNTELKLRELLLPVFGLDSIEEVKPEYSLINDIGADSLDFVEIIHLIDRNFGVELTASSIMIGGNDIDTDDLFIDGKLTEDGLKLLKETFTSRKDHLFLNMTKVDLFTLLTVEDLALIIEDRINKKEN